MTGALDLPDSPYTVKRYILFSRDIPEHSGAQAFTTPDAELLALA
jgi:hypothetical protein